MSVVIILVKYHLVTLLISTTRREGQSQTSFLPYSPSNTSPGPWGGTPGRAPWRLGTSLIANWNTPSTPASIKLDHPSRDGAAAARIAAAALRDSGIRRARARYVRSCPATGTLTLRTRESDHFWTGCPEESLLEIITKRVIGAIKLFSPFLTCYNHSDGSNARKLFNG